MLFDALITHFFNYINCLSCRFFIIRNKRIKVFTVACKSDRNNRSHINTEVFKIGQCSDKLVTVINSGTGNNLTVKRYSCVCKAFEIFQCIACKTVIHHLTTKLGVCCVNRHINRAYVHFYNSVNFVLCNICQRDIVAEQKRKSAVIILKIERLTHPLRKLVNKAENAFITARMLFVHKIGFKLKTDFLIFSLGHFYGTNIFVLILNLKSKLAVHLIESVIKNIDNLV